MNEEEMLTIEYAIRTVLSHLGYTLAAGSHTAETPERVARMYRELLVQRPLDSLTTFESDIDEMVVVKNIQFYTFCAHHMIPFFGIAHIGYVPQGRILGLSKFARVVRYYSTRLNVQEELTRDIGKRLSGALNPLGIAVVMSAEHLCMTMRGIRSPGAQMTTSYMTGVFRDDNNNARQEFLALINGRI